MGLKIRAERLVFQTAPSRLNTRTLKAFGFRISKDGKTATRKREERGDRDRRHWCGTCETWVRWISDDGKCTECIFRVILREEDGAEREGR